MEMEEIQPPAAWKPTQVEESVEGVLVKKETEVGINNSNLYHLKDKNDKQVSVWGTTVLDQRMNFVEEGEYVKITYKGTEKNKKGQDTKIFKVFKAKKA